MKHQKTIILLVVSALFVFLPGLVSFFTQPTSAQTNKPQIITVKNKSVPPSSRIKKIISGAVAPAQIPDNVAYELFLRTVAEGNARVLVKRAGINDDEIENIMNEAYSFNSILEASDRDASSLKTNKEKLPKIQINAELSILQKRKDEYIAKTVNRFLSGSLHNEEMKKLQNFIKTEIKSNIQKVLIKDSSQAKEVALNKPYTKSFASRQSGGGELYLYSAGWNDGMNVYGSGSISEQYTSGTSYLVTVTVTSPLGRSNTTQSDWSYATVINDTGLSIGDEDGTYTVQANFEEQLGYYDEYGNFYGTGSSFVGSSTGGADVAPLITLSNLIFTQMTIPATAGATSNLIATVNYSRSVPQDTTVEMELNDSVTGQGNPLYNVNMPTIDPISGGVVIPNSGNREVKLTVPAPGAIPRSVRVTFPFVLSANTGSGTVSANVRLGNVMPQTSPTIQINPPLGSSIVLTISPTPTPSPSPTPGGGGFAGCVPECFEADYACPCYGQGGVAGLRPSCDTSTPAFIKASYSPTKILLPECNCQVTPILIDVAGNGFAMTNATSGVPFDFNGDGIISGKLAWTTANSDDAWLVLDRSQNNRIDNGSELFGNAAPQPAPPEGEERQGFLALAEYDKPANGGNGDGKITRRDAVFRKLRLWQDRNHNGISEAEELSRLPALDVVAIFLDYQQSRRTDEHGNKFKYRARVRDRQGANIGRWAWDVFLTSAR